MVDRGVEQKILDVFDNKRIPLKHGYLMVKCRTQEDIDQKIELAEAQRKEEQFFIRSSKFHVVPKDRRGSAALGQFLSRQLVTRIKQTIPQLLMDLNLKITKVDEECRSMGIDDYKQISTTAEARTRYLTEKLFASMQIFRNEIHHVEQGAQVNNNPFYAKRNEFNQQFYHEMHRCKFDHGKLIREIKAAMIATQGPEPSDVIHCFSSHRFIELILFSVHSLSCHKNCLFTIHQSNTKTNGKIFDQYVRTNELCYFTSD